MISHNGRIFTAPRDIANAINEAFLKKVSTLTGKIPSTTDSCPLERLKKYLAAKEVPQDKFELKPISIHQLRRLLSL